MANNIAGNPLIIDSAAAGMIVPGPIRIAGIIATGLTTTGDSVIIQDSDGTTARVVYERTIATALDVASGYEPINVMCKRGISCTTLTHGKVYIYLGTGGSDA